MILKERRRKINDQVRWVTSAEYPCPPMLGNNEDEAGKYLVNQYILNLSLFLSWPYTP